MKEICYMLVEIFEGNMIDERKERKRVDFSAVFFFADIASLVQI